MIPAAGQLVASQCSLCSSCLVRPPSKPSAVLTSLHSVPVMPGNYPCSYPCLRWEPRTSMCSAGPAARTLRVLATPGLTLWRHGAQWHLQWPWPDSAVSPTVMTQHRLSNSPLLQQLLRGLQGGQGGSSLCQAGQGRLQGGPDTPTPAWPAPTLPACRQAWPACCRSDLVPSGRPAS